MAKYLLKRLGTIVIIMILVSFASFFLVNLVPGDVVYTVAGSEEIDDELYDQIYHELNLDKSPIQRYLIWAGNALKGDFGKSYIYNRSVWDLIKDRIPTTLYLSIVSIVLSVPLGILFGVITAVFRKKWPDTVLTLFANILNCLPEFWVGLLLMYLLCFKLKLLPSLGFGFPAKVGWAKFLQTSILPIICCSLNATAGFTRQTRTSMLEVIRQDFIRTARSKGISERKIYMKHMLKNGLIPIITVLGARLSFILGGSMIIENIFTLPGMGALAKTCVSGKDIPTLQAIVILTTAVSCLAYILTDIVYVIVDPRISIGESGD